MFKVSKLARNLLLMPCALVISGCYTTKTRIEYTFDKKNGTNAEYNKVNKECHYEGDKIKAIVDARSTYTRAFFAGADVYVACMKKNGWQLKRSEQTLKWVPMYPDRTSTPSISNP